MSISLLNELLTQQSQQEPPIDQNSWAELDTLAIPEHSRLYRPNAESFGYVSQAVISTVISR